MRSEQVLMRIQESYTRTYLNPSVTFDAILGRQLDVGPKEKGRPSIALHDGESSFTKNLYVHREGFPVDRRDDEGGLGNEAIPDQKRSAGSRTYCQ